MIDPESIEPGRGLFVEMDEATYHGSEITSRSRLDVLRVSPALYHARFVARTVGDTDTAAMRVGRMLHAAVLEPDRWSAFAVPPEVDRRTRDGKAAYAAWQEQNPKAEVVSAKEHALVLAMAEAVAAHPLASRLCSGCTGVSERAMVWRDEETGKLVRARVDRHDEAPPVIVDLKKVAQLPTPETFARVVVNHWYHGQAAMYLDGARAVTGIDHRFALVAVHESAPHEVGVYELGEDEIELGRRQYRAALRELQWRREEHDWHSDWEKRPHVIRFPGWAFAAEEWTNG